MSNIARVTDALDHTATILKRGAEILAYVTVAVVLLCVMALFVSGFYGIVHDGDDFGVDLGGQGSAGD
jgi:hypothetical protein